MEPSSQVGKGGLAPEEPSYVVPLKNFMNKAIVRKKSQSGAGAQRLRQRQKAKKRAENKSFYKGMSKFAKKKRSSIKANSNQNGRKKNKESKKTSWSP